MFMRCHHSAIYNSELFEINFIIGIYLAFGRSHDYPFAQTLSTRQGQSSGRNFCSECPGKEKI